MNGDLKPTTRLRWLERVEDGVTVKTLQQWFAPDVPGYMRDESKGEWRDVLTVRDPP